MNALKLNQSVLTYVGVCAVEENATLQKRIWTLLFYGLMILMNLINIVVCGLYFIKYISIDYDGGIYAILAVTVLLCLLYVLFSLRYHSKKLRTIFETLDEINRRGWTTRKLKFIIHKDFVFAFRFIQTISLRYSNRKIGFILVHTSLFAGFLYYVNRR